MHSLDYDYYYNPYEQFSAFFHINEREMALLI